MMSASVVALSLLGACTGAPAPPPAAGRPLAPEPARTWVAGPGVDTPEAAAWVQAQGGRRLRLPVTVAFADELRLRIDGARLGEGPDALRLQLDDAALGVALLDRLRACPPGPRCRVWLEGVGGAGPLAPTPADPGAWPFRVLRFDGLAEAGAAVAVEAG